MNISIKAGLKRDILPVSVSRSNDGYIFISDYRNKCIIKLNRSGDVAGIFGKNENLEYPGNLDIVKKPTSNECIILCEPFKGRVLFYDLDGNLLRIFSPLDKGTKILREPVSVFLDDDHNLFVLDRTLNRILVFDNGGTQIRTSGKRLNRIEEELLNNYGLCEDNHYEYGFEFPCFMKQDEEGRTFVLDPLNNRICMLDKNLDWLGEIELDRDKSRDFKSAAIDFISGTGEVILTYDREFCEFYSLDGEYKGELRLSPMERVFYFCKDEKEGDLMILFGEGDRIRILPINQLSIEKKIEKAIRPLSIMTSARLTQSFEEFSKNGKGFLDTILKQIESQKERTDRINSTILEEIHSFMDDWEKNNKEKIALNSDELEVKGERVYLRLVDFNDSNIELMRYNSFLTKLLIFKDAESVLQKSDLIKDYFLKYYNSIIETFKEGCKRLEKSLDEFLSCCDLRDCIKVLWEIYVNKHEVNNYMILLTYIEKRSISFPKKILEELITRMNFLLDRVKIFGDSLFTIFYNPSKVYLYMGNIMFSQQRFEKALEYYRLENERIPFNAVVIERLISTYFKSGELDKGNQLLANYNRLLEDNLSTTILSRLYFSSGNYIKSLEYVLQNLRNDYTESDFVIFSKNISMLDHEKLLEFIEGFKDNALIYFNLGRCYRALEDWEKLHFFINKFIESGEKFRGLFRITGDVLYANGDIEGALENSKRELEQYPDDADTYVSMGRLYFERSDKSEEALKYFQKALELGSIDQSLRYFIGFIFYERGEFDAAYKCVLENIDLNPNYDLNYVLLADILVKSRGEYEEGIRNYDKALKLNPDLEGIHYKIGEVQFLTGNFGAALEHFLIEKKRAGSYKELEKLIDETYSMLKLKGCFKIIEDLKSKLSDSNPTVDLYYHLYKANIDLRKYDEAYTSIIKQIELTPDVPDYYFEYGSLCLFHLNREKEGFEAYHKGLSFGNPVQKRHFQLGQAYEMKGEFEKARYQYEKEIELFGFDPDVYNRLGEFYFNKLCDYSRSRECFMKLIEKGEPELGVQLWTGRTYYMQGENFKAYDWFLKEIKMYPENPKAHFYLGVVSLKRWGKVDKSIGHYEDCLKLNSIYMNLYLHLAQAYRQKGNYQRALEFYLKELKYYPKNPIKGEILGEILGLSIIMMGNNNNQSVI